MPHWKKLTNPNYIGAYSLDGGKDMNVTIEKVVQEEVQSSDGRADECVVAYLKGEKPFILNKTNCKSIEKCLGSPDTDAWIGGEITIYIAKVSAFGETVDALRVREKTVEKKLPVLNEKNPKWADAKKAIEAGSTDIETIKLHYKITPKDEKILCGK